MKEVITVIVKKRASSAMRPMIDTLPRCRFILFLRLCDKCSLQREREQPRSQGFFAGMVLLVGWRWAGLQRWSLAVNDPQSANGPQIGPEMMSINVMEKNRNGVDSIRSRLIYGEDTKSSLTKEAIKTGTHTLCQITKLKWKYTSNFWATRKWKELFTMHLLRVLKI